MMTDEVEKVTDDDESQQRPASRRKDPEPRQRSGGGWRFVLLGVALLVAASGSFAWWQTSGDEDRKTAETRDAVLLQARQDIATMNTLDYRKVDAGVKAWGAVTTGTLRDQLTQVSKEDRQLLAEQKKISTGRVVDASVVDLDASSATVIAAVEVTVQDAAKPDSEPTVKRNRFSADIVKVGGRWRIETLQQVAVSLS
ncbi:nuclear transport factor 2 family protein [Aeromicrobium sp. YC3-14]|nr:nuclear transport factor 2 family protein [Aeromicrobium stalagmiti]